MAFSLKKISVDGAAFFQGFVAKTSWTEDLKRGLRVLLSGGVLLADRSFSEVELHKLRGGLDQCEESLNQCFQTLGEKSMAHWKNQQELDAKERDRLFAQIEVLKAEKEKLLASMSVLKTPSELNTPLDTPPSASSDAGKVEHPEETP